MALETDILIGLSISINALFILLYMQINRFWQTQGTTNFLSQQIKASLNRIKNPKLVYGANHSRYAPISIVGDNEPIYPDPTNKIGLPLQFEPKNIFYGPRGMPVIFAFQGALANVNPLENTNDDIELGQAAQTTEKFIQVEVERRYQKDNPFQKLSRLFLLHGVVMVLGFVVLGAVLLNIQSIAGEVGNTIGKFAPIAENIINNPSQFGLPENLIGQNPSSPPQPNPFFDPLHTATPVEGG